MGKGQMRVNGWNHQETREWSYEKSQLTTWLKPSAPFITGSIAYTKPQFCLVKCTILALPWLLNKCPDAVFDESFDGLKDWWCWSSSSSGFEGWWTPKDVILAQWWLGVSSQVESEKKKLKRDICWDPRIFGWMERQGRKAWHKNLRVQKSSSSHPQLLRI